MNALIHWFFNPAGVTPHGFCLLWQPGLLWTHALSDLTIGIAYLAISLALAVFARRRGDLAFRPVFWCFATFVLLCGLGHWLALLTLWVPAYGIEGTVKVATATVSVVTAAALWRLLPQALALPSPAQLSQANAALRDSEARHRVSFERSPAPLYTLDDNDIVIDVSDSWLALLGYARDEVVGRAVTQFREAGSEAGVEADRVKLMSEGEVCGVERRFQRRDGTMVDALVSARLEHRDGAVWIVCALVDITARKQAEEALRISEKRLHQAQKMEAVGQLTGGIAHDFNNLLQGIAGALDIMERRVSQGRADEVVRYVEPMRQSVSRAATLTRRMLAFGRRQVLQARPVEPDGFIRGMATLIQHTVGPTVRMEMHLHDGWLAYCDPSQLESALVDLAANARDAMPGGGTFTVATADRHLTEADLSSDGEAEPGDYLEISIADTGIGMSIDVKSRAFEPFYTTKSNGRGTGLGLPQLYGFVRQSGGHVRIESEVGRGTIVRLYLPRYEHLGTGVVQAVVDDAAMQVDRAADAARRTVLVVDDEPEVRAAVTELLRELGYKVLEEADGLAGLRIVQSIEQLDLLVSDVGLPGLNGRQLADAARECRPGLPVLFITGYAGTALDDVRFGPGLDTIHKPFGLNVLATKIEAMLAKAAPAPED